MPRDVDIAMAEDRPAKETVRDLWTGLVLLIDEDDELAQAFPVYLTLSGAEGRDIEKLVASGVLRTTETGAIHSDDLGKVVAIEASSLAVSVLKRRFPGLRVLQMPVRDLVRGDGLTTWPQGEHRNFCKALVVNLDLNRPLSGETRDGQLFFPILRWIEKIAQLHAEAPRVDWTLCLTLHGEAPWDECVSERVQQNLQENFAVAPRFADRCRTHFGAELFGRISDSAVNAFSYLEPEDQQKLLMAFVPKTIAKLAVRQGWRVETAKNLRYGGGKAAPIVTWIFEFRWDERASTIEATVYTESLEQTLQGIGTIAEDGSIS